MPEKKLNLTLKNTLKELETLRGELVQFGKTAHLSKKHLQHLNLVLDELFTNIVSYGEREEGTCQVRILISQDEQRLTLEVEDCGVPFNPVKAETPDLESSLEERAIGGMGIHIVKTLMDEIRYERKGDKNLLTLIKQLS
jgi:anti-sigma regulatory factor (Ser/Thr protein kinase)